MAAVVGWVVGATRVQAQTHLVPQPWSLENELLLEHEHHQGRPCPALVVGLVAGEPPGPGLGHDDRNRWLAGVAPESETARR